MKRKYLVWSIERSGHHAIMNWICKQAKSAMLVNDVIPDKLGIERGAVEYKDGVPSTQHTVIPKDCLNPDTEITLFSFADNYVHKIDELEKAGFDKNIIIVRDPYNLFASRMKAMFCNVEYTTKHGRHVIPIDAYKQHIKECKSAHNIDINYNEWFSSKVYRKELADRLSIEFTDDGLNDVLTGMAYGCASSFDSNTFANNGQGMKVLERYKKVDTSKLIDDELKTIANDIFKMRV